jgi:hypothetical protein
MFLYKSIKKALTSAYGNPEGNPLRRLSTLAAMICGTIRTSKSYLHSLGSELPQDIDLESRVKHVKRWLTNNYTDYNLSFLPFIGPVLASHVSQGKEMVFAIDGSEAGQGCTVLMISLTVGKRAMPICWLVKKCRKGHLPAKMHLEVFTILHKVLKGYENVTVLGDGEFDNGEVVTACAGWKWRFVFRTAKSTKIYDGEGECPIKNLWPQAGEKFFIVHDVAYTKYRHGPVNAIVWTERNWEGPLYLLSNFELSYTFAFYYRKRWSIETLFGDVKSRGFNVHKSKLADPERVAKLLIVICLAYILIFKIGEEEQNSPIISKVTRKDRTDLSIFTVGKKLVDYCIKRSIEIVFSFSKNCFISTSYKSVR